MVKVFNLIFGIVIALIGINSIFGFFTEPDYMFFVVGGIGLIVMFIPVRSDSKFFKLVTRWIFGGFLILSALLSLIGGIPFLELIQYGNWFAGAVIIFIGLIYFLTSFRSAVNRDLYLET